MMQIKIWVKAGSAGNKIEGIRNGELVVKIKAAPEKGKANRELTAFLSKTWKIPRSGIVIKRGHTSPHKIILIADEYGDKSGENGRIR